MAKLQNHATKLEKSLFNQKTRKLRDLVSQFDVKEDVVGRFKSRVEDFAFRDHLTNFTEDTIPGAEDIVTLANLNDSIISFTNSLSLDSFSEEVT